MKYKITSLDGVKTSEIETDIFISFADLRVQWIDYKEDHIRVVLEEDFVIKKAGEGRYCIEPYENHMETI